MTKGILITGIILNLKKVFEDVRIGKHESGYDEVICKLDGNIYSCTLDIDTAEGNAKEYANTILHLINRVYSENFQLKEENNMMNDKLNKELNQVYENFFGETLKKVDAILEKKEENKKNINYKKELENANLNQTFNKWFGDLM